MSKFYILNPVINVSPENRKNKTKTKFKIFLIYDIYLYTCILLA